MSPAAATAVAHGAPPVLPSPANGDTPSATVFALPSASALSVSIGEHVQRYLARLGDTLYDSDDLYERFLAELERPLLAQVMQATGGNQLKTAKILGINRNTLRKKLLQHRLMDTH